MGNAWESSSELASTEKNTETTYSNDVDPGANGHSDENLVSASEESLFGLSAPVFDEPANKAERTEILNRNTAPRGIYQTDPSNFGPMTITTSGKDFDDERRVVMISGRVKATIKGKEYTAFIRGQKFFKLSPDVRKAKLWEDGKPVGVSEEDDSATKLWFRAEEAYSKTFKGEAESRQQVIDFLGSGEYKIKLNPYNGEIYVRDVLPMKG